MAKKNIFQRLAESFGKSKADLEREKAAELAKEQREAIQKMRDAEAKAEAAVKEAVKPVQEAAEKVEAGVKAAAREVDAAAEEAKQKAAEFEAESKRRTEEYLAKKAAEEEAKAAAAARAASIVATHTVQANETLSSIALQYYGHALPAYYKHIYEFNKDVIGDNMNLIRPGQTLQIPVLPDELK